MDRKLPRLIWNMISLFLLGWFAAAGWLLSGGETSPVVRFAFALCGSAGLLAGSTGGLFSVLGKGVRWIERKNLGCCAAIVCCLLLVAAFIMPVFMVANGIARASRIACELKQEGLRLLEYAEAHDGTLPPVMGRGSVYRYIAPTARVDRFRRPFVWCGELGGLRLDDIASPAKVVVAYADEQDGKRCPVLFLDGHVKSAHSRQELRNKLRDRSAFLADAVRKKSLRESRGITAQALRTGR